MNIFQTGIMDIDGTENLRGIQNCRGQSQILVSPKQEPFHKSITPMYSKNLGLFICEFILYIYL